MRKVIYTGIKSITGNVISLEASGVKFGEIASIQTSRGKSLAEVIHIEGKLVHLQVFIGGTGISTDDEVTFLGHGMKVSFSDNLLGRVFNGCGYPLDNGPELLDDLIDIKSQSINPARRKIPNRMIHTKIPMIDVFNSLAVSQKLPIFSSSGEDYNELLSRIATQADSDIIILAGIGLKYDDYLKLKNTLHSSGSRSKSIMFIHTASDPVVESLVIPDMALCVAQKFALKNKDVLVLITDMTNYAESLKEISITMEQVPSNRGYPGDLYSRLASRYEKAVDFADSGSVTILAVTTMPDDDITHPVPDNTGYITEGQLYLKNGKIDPFASLSRLKQLVNKDTRKDHRALMDAMIKLYAQCSESREKKSLGFEMSTWDEKLLKYGLDFEERLMSLEVNLDVISALNTGWEILAANFDKNEEGIRSDLISEFWLVTENV